MRKAYGGTNFTKHVYTYDKAGRLIADSVYEGLTNSFIPRTIFKYDDKDNLIEWQNYYYNSYTKKVESWSICEASHYNHINPYANLAVPLYFITDYYETYMLSKNNISQVRYNGTSRSYDYEYDSRGLPKKMIDSDDKESYREFYYE